MYSLHHRFNEVATHAQLFGLVVALTHHCAVALCLHDLHVVLLLVLPYFAGYGHAPAQHLEQLIVALVDVLTQQRQVFG